ncbi:MAG: glutamate-1-semialdehyde 2,1-aminomutase, partial [Planctomycetota bacterium]
MLASMSKRYEKSEAAFNRACNVLVGGVNSPVRAFSGIDRSPVVISKAGGSRVTDIDGNEYIDYVASYGPGILGHAPEMISTAISKAVRHGTSFGAPTETETMVAEAVVQAVESIEKVRFVSSGTEGVMTAVRLARGATGRDKIIKCIGCYHGHSDSMLVAAGSGAATIGQPSSPGVPEAAAGQTILVPYNDASAVEDAMAQNAGQIAAMIVEPVAGNMGTIAPADGYLAELRELCNKAEALLIFDEVITGFRLSYGGAQGVYEVQPDLTVLGKVIGGGLPVGALGGRAELMDQLAPLGSVFQAGTLSGNPLAMAAGLATLQSLQTEDFYDDLENAASSLKHALHKAAEAAEIDEQVTINRVGSMLTVFFHPGPVTNFAQAEQANKAAFAAWFAAMLDEGIYLPPSPFETLFVSSAHDAEDIKATGKAARVAFTAAASHL